MEIEASDWWRHFRHKDHKKICSNEASPWSIFFFSCSPPSVVWLMSAFFRSSPFLKKVMGTLGLSLSPFLGVPCSNLENRREAMESWMVWLLCNFLFPLRRTAIYTLEITSLILYKMTVNIFVGLWWEKEQYLEIC